MKLTASLHKSHRDCFGMAVGLGWETRAAATVVRCFDRANMELHPICLQMRSSSCGRSEVIHGDGTGKGERETYKFTLQEEPDSTKVVINQGGALHNRYIIITKSVDSIHRDDPDAPIDVVQKLCHLGSRQY